MLVKRIAIENVRSFLERAELRIDGEISILIGPNGGGKTNLLDTLVTLLRRYLFASVYAMPSPTPEQPDRFQIRENDVLNQLVLEKHSRGANRSQIVEIEIEVTQQDIANMTAMKADADMLMERAGRKYMGLSFQAAKEWDVDQFSPGLRLRYRLENGTLQFADGEKGQWFKRYLGLYEIDGKIRDELGLMPLSTPLVYLPVTRTASGFQSNVELGGFNDSEIKRQLDGALSRNSSSLVSLAIGRLAQKYRLLLEDGGAPKERFLSDPNLIQLTQMLRELGYDWDLVSVQPLKNQYDVQLRKHGTAFLVGAASSGEKELLTYLFAIYALNVRNAFIIVDEPELHLHPKWQKTLLGLFIRLAQSTGNHFLFATHSPTFVSPASIRFVSRVYSENQMSRILTMDVDSLPDVKHLLNIVNSQNNERIFFADEVILVEGISDRIVFERLFERARLEGRVASKTVEVVSVGGKGLFEAYAKVLRAASISFAIIADLDYVVEVGSPEIRGLFVTNMNKIKSDVLDNVKSKDGEALVGAIDAAMEAGDWSGAMDIWQYIKSKRIALSPDLSDEQRDELNVFLKEKQAARIFVLSRGSLEAYLPDGFASKDVGKLVDFLSDDAFFEQLPERGRAELEEIIEALGIFQEVQDSTAAEIRSIGQNVELMPENVTKSE